MLASSPEPPTSGSRETTTKQPVMFITIHKLHEERPQAAMPHKSKARRLERANERIRAWHKARVKAKRATTSKEVAQ